jgi:hypothetical protein
MPRARSRLSIGFVGCLALGFAATGASATVLGPSLDALKPAMPRFDLEKVHEGHGGMHQGCYRHKAPGAYPDCHWHYFNSQTGKWEIRRRLLDGTPCPKNNECAWQ